ncbi:MAG: hypothetical protein AAF637_14570 [Pseudomonadota bacterium]
MRLVVFAFALAFGWSSPAWSQATGMIVPCGDPLGQWVWQLGGMVAFEEDGTVTWKPSADSDAGFRGSWECDLTDGAVVVEWEHGFTDRLHVDLEGLTLSGTNQEGVAIEARRPEAPSEAAATTVDLALVGTWLLEIQLPSPQGPVPVWWTITPDGNYTIDAGPFSHAGTMTAGGSHFELAATTSDFRDHGRYEISDWATIVVHGQQGPGRWHRREPALKLAVVEINAQLIPAEVPAVTDAARGLARSWQPDALLARVDYDRPSGTRATPPEVELFFFSPSSGLGLWVNVSTAGTSFFGASRADGLAIPNGFLDLPQAWTIARQYGVAPPLERALLRVWTPEGGEPVLAWSISGNGAAANIDATEGNRLEGDLSGYVAAYNAQWQEAVAGLRRLLARPRSSSSSSDDWSYSSDDDDDDSGYGYEDPYSSSDDYGVASQNAWGSGDMGAYDRIQAGTPTGEDCARHGC